MRPGPKPTPIADRFWKHVDKNGPIPNRFPELGPCWIWTGSTMSGGYGKFRLSNPRKLAPAHRIAYELHFGIELKHCGCHKCDNPPCCNPSHLFDGTALDNTLDAVSKGRMRNSAHLFRGESHPLHKLTWPQVLEIRQRRMSGEFLKNIAADYGVVYQTVQRIVEGKNWKGENYGN